MQDLNIGHLHVLIPISANCQYTRSPYHNIHPLWNRSLQTCSFYCEPKYMDKHIKSTILEIMDEILGKNDGTYAVTFG